MTPRFEYSAFIDGPLAWMFVGRGRKPGGQLLRKRRLFKKYTKWRSWRLDLERRAAEAVDDVFTSVVNERSFARTMFEAVSKADQDGGF